MIATGALILGVCTVASFFVSTLIAAARHRAIDDAETVRERRRAIRHDNAAFRRQLLIGAPSPIRRSNTTDERKIR